MKRIFKLLSICVAMLALTTACNKENPYVTTTDYGFISSYISPTIFTINTDFKGEIYPLESNVGIKQEDVGKRVRVVYELIKDGTAGAPAQVIYKQVGTVKTSDMVYQSEVLEKPADEQEKFWDEAGYTALKYHSVWIKKGMMNVEMMVPTNSVNSSPNGDAKLIYMDTESTKSEKVFKLCYNAKGDASKFANDFVTFNAVGEIFSENIDYKVIIKYKSLELPDGGQATIEFTHNPTGN